MPPLNKWVGTMASSARLAEPKDGLSGKETCQTIRFGGSKLTTRGSLTKLANFSHK